MMLTNSVAPWGNQDSLYYLYNVGYEEANLVLFHLGTDYLNVAIKSLQGITNCVSIHNFIIQGGFIGSL